MTKLDPRLPVIVGVGQIVHRDGDAPAPAELAAAAARLAAADAGRADLVARARVVAAAPIVSWRYGDAAAAVADLLGATPDLTMTPAVGGNTPQMLMGRLGEMIMAGETDIALLCGAECYRTRMAARRDGANPDWVRQDLTVEPGWTDPAPFDMFHPAEMAAGILLPTQVYPLFENALRHHRGRSAAEHTAAIAELWAGFSRIAADNPHAWDRVAHDADEIATPTAENRMIGAPYTRFMVSNPSVDMASAAVVCSVAAARDAGIDPDRWVFLHSGAESSEPTVSERRDFFSSEAIGRGGRAALAAAGIGIDDVGPIDVYSCFPSAVEIACRELGVSEDATLTVYGGLSFAGGPWNNPVGHALAAMTDVLRSKPGEMGLVTANGGMIQKHAFGVYATTPPARFERVAVAPIGAPVAVAESHEGPATVEAYTVMADREGNWERAHLAFRTAASERGWAASHDPDVMASMAVDDWVGRAIDVADGELRPA